MRDPRPLRPIHRPRTLAGAAAVAAALTLLAGCGRDDRAVGPAGPAAPTSTGPSTTVAADVTADVSGFRFEPEVIRADAGAAVRWTNTDEVLHTVTADDGSFDVELARAGGSGDHRFARPGTYGYHCDVHPSMTGTVVVG